MQFSLGEWKNVMVGCISLDLVSNVEKEDIGLKLLGA